MSNRKLRMGMIGGGKDAFIGAIHRIAANMDGQIDLVCGALSMHADVAQESGKLLFLAPDRIYDTYDDMFKAEAQKPADERMDFVTIVTPNFAHFAPAMQALENGFNVVVEKPVTFTLEEAQQLKAKVEETGLMLLLTHTYAGYPMVKEARQLVKSGKLGKVRKIYVEYIQGWLSRLSEREGNAGAAWRTDPKKSGKSGCMGDIGTHAAHLAEYISGLKITELNASLNIVVDGRMLDDDGAVLLRFEEGATGTLIASQVAAGEENALKIRVYGEEGSLEWAQMEPNTLTVKWIDKPAETLRAGSNYADRLSTYATSNCRTPGGHPEGYLEAFGNLYRNFALALSAKIEGVEPNAEWLDFPSIDDGIRGMAFINNVVASNESNEKWTKYTI
ncbi:MULTISPECIES: Gfo/Idh/MocA family oxidoreductase [unclassified Mucilaginibacter]|uniref:Gfo/Idh/MocA family protein n=1 Tax=unclassified Mucilaginibacter TaxID=2617802 RepID=UPI002AC90746|nr:MULTISPECIES: Gfo/Idh/MocA family oxidoreductase [unclassified Mucilaginibacter]MEB0248920.1 Gfo/Idh/MocA family oxidoreductase [Mucilaginibacter sp. 5B2]MEB0262736.1 Gfo/Idh/MocA family oxidoreductase [Mucilaginibacter sp. 10I4]MEB0279507.1 Gfo/Idh/MocA family oxidoreductase [Mucilaginibacter sp. 10B2]MEB0302543.1 Gfo/Idh/MocA family oxidoreductase [Mucilaginibacter sp. 5C4]WPX22625.1 Gfo/Idh/MocA family oxidoreductase [Mucilaginibacter sp. 5C4]